MDFFAMDRQQLRSLDLKSYTSIAEGQDLQTKLFAPTAASKKRTCGVTKAKLL